MITEPFTTGNSVIHHVDPRLKIVFAVMLSCVVAVANSLPTLFAGLTVALLLIALARLEGWAVLKRLAVVVGFIALIWVVLPITYPGPPLVEVGPMQISRPGVALCLKITLKSITILFILIALVATTTLSSIGSALHRLGVPGKPLENPLQVGEGKVSPIILLAADAGLRVGEISRLQWHDVRNRYIHVAVRGEHDQTKSGRSTRSYMSRIAGSPSSSLIALSCWRR